MMGLGLDEELGSAQWTSVLVGVAREAPHMPEPDGCNARPGQDDGVYGLAVRGGDRGFDGLSALARCLSCLFRVGLGALLFRFQGEDGLFRSSSSSGESRRRRS